MGWCSATEIFDSVCNALLAGKSKEQTIKELIEELEGNDWDCQGDSEYYDHPIVKAIFRELHPDWFEEES
jgi:hypothetical protein